MAGGGGECGEGGSATNRGLEAFRLSEVVQAVKQSYSLCFFVVLFMPVWCVKRRASLLCLLLLFDFNFNVVWLKVKNKATQ